MRVYLAGPVLSAPGAAWRDRFIEAVRVAGVALAGESTIASWVPLVPGRPMADGSGGEERSDIYVPADLVSVRSADMLVAYLDAAHAGRGTAIEIGYAWGRGIPVLAIIGPDDMTEAEAAAAHLVGFYQQARDDTRHAWRFLLGLVPATYSMESAAAAIAYAARQTSGR